MQMYGFWIVNGILQDGGVSVADRDEYILIYPHETYVFLFTDNLAEAGAVAVQLAATLKPRRSAYRVELRRITQPLNT